MPTAMKFLVNCSTSDSSYPTSGVNWVEVALASDSIIFSNGSDIVIDGASIPTEFQLTQAGIIKSVSEQIVPHYFLADVSSNLLQEIHNAGNQNKRYVFAFNFDGATASEPVLELWDNDDMDTVDLVSLGGGDPTASWWRGVVTTDGLPGTNWVGSKLAGASSTHYLELNNGNGALSGAETLYCNLKIVCPANFTQAAADKPVLVVKYTTA